MVSATYVRDEILSDRDPARAERDCPSAIGGRPRPVSAARWIGSRPLVSPQSTERHRATGEKPVGIRSAQSSSSDGMPSSFSRTAINRVASNDALARLVLLVDRQRFLEAVVAAVAKQRVAFGELGHHLRRRALRRARGGEDKHDAEIRRLSGIR